MKKLIPILMAAAIPFSAAQASLRVSPMFVDLGSQRDAEVTLVNNGEFPLDVSFAVTQLNERARGYLIYPPMINDLEPGERRTVRVMRKTPNIEPSTFVEVSTLNDNYKVRYKLSVVDGVN